MTEQNVSYEADRVIRNLAQKLAEAHVQIAQYEAVVAQLLEGRNERARVASATGVPG